MSTPRFSVFVQAPKPGEKVVLEEDIAHKEKMKADKKALDAAAKAISSGKKK